MLILDKPVESKNWDQHFWHFKLNLEKAKFREETNSRVLTKNSEVQGHLISKIWILI